MGDNTVIGDLLNQAQLAEKTGQIVQAEACYTQILRLEPTKIEIMQYLINLAQKTKRWQDTGLIIDDAIKKGANLAVGYFFLGYICKSMGNVEASSQYYRAMLEASNYETLFLLGKMAYENAEYDEAVNIVKQALTFGRDRWFAILLNNLAVRYTEQDDFLKAGECYKQAFQIDAANNEICFNMGTFLAEQGDYDNAIILFNKILSEKGSNPEYLNNFGTCLIEKGQIDLALKYLKQAVEMAPNYTEARANLGKLLLLMGNLEDGFRENEWRPQRRRYAQGSHPVWKGEIFSGKRLLVQSEQGYGDILQFARYLPLVKSRGGTVLFSTRKELKAVFNELPNVDVLLEQSDEVIANTKFDLTVPLISLPFIFGTSLKTIPHAIPYLTVDKKRTEFWRRRLPDNGKIKVGLVWAAKFTDQHSRERSCGFKPIASLLTIKGIDFYSLQKGEGAKQLLTNGEQIIDHTESLHDFGDTAALIENLDLVITVDTSVAHLAGGLGKPVWTMLRFIPDWRWLLYQEDTAWYPTMRLFRQKSPGDWDGVVQQVAKELYQLISGK